MGCALGESLSEWLRVRAGVHERILDKTLRALEEAEVFEVEDLVHMERLPDFGLCFSAVTGSKVRAALALRAAGTAAPVAPPPASSPASCCTMSNETEAGKSTTITTSPGDLIDVQPRSPAGRAVGFGGETVVEIAANEHDEAARADLRNARETAVRAAQAEVKCPLPWRLAGAVADAAAMRIQAAVRRARVLAAATGPAAFFAPPVLPTLVELTLRARAWYGDRPAFPPEQLAVAEEDRVDMVADLCARPGHLGAAARAAVDGPAGDAEARRRAKKNAKAKVRRGRARAAKQADAEASVSCAMAGETEVGTSTTTPADSAGTSPPRCLRRRQTLAPGARVLLSAGHGSSRRLFTGPRVGHFPGTCCTRCTGSGRARWSCGGRSGRMSMTARMVGGGFGDSARLLSFGMGSSGRQTRSLRARCPPTPAYGSGGRAALRATTTTMTAMVSATMTISTALRWASRTAGGVCFRPSMSGAELPTQGWPLACPDAA